MGLRIKFACRCERECAATGGCRCNLSLIDMLGRLCSLNANCSAGFCVVLKGRIERDKSNRY